MGIYGYPSDQSSADSTSYYVVTQADVNLPNGQVITAGTGIAITVSGGLVTITNAATGAGLGSVTNFSAGNANPIFTTNVTNPTSTPNLAFTLTTQTSGAVLIGPSSGSSATPTYRVLTGNDIVNAITAGTNVTIVNLGSALQISATGGSGSGTVTSVSDSGLSGLFTSSTANPTTTPAISHTFVSQTCGTALMGPSGGGAAAPTFRGIVSPDIFPFLIPGNNVTLTQSGINLTISAAGSSNSNGTVTSAGLSMPAIFSVANSPITTSGNFNVTLVAEPCGTFFSGPSGGVSATPTFRGIVGPDIYSALSAGSNVTVTQTGNTVTIASTNPGGTVTNLTAGNANPIFTVSVASPTSTPAITFTLDTTNANTGLMGPTGGAAATPTYRQLGYYDLPIIGGSNIELTTTGNSLVVNATGLNSGTVTNVAVNNLSPLFTSSTVNPTTTPTVSFTQVTQTSGQVYASPATGAAGNPLFRQLQAGDISSALTAGSNITLTQTGSTLSIASTASGGGGGTVTNVSVGNLSPLFTSSTSNPTTTPSTSYTQVQQACGQIFGGPLTGANANPNFRSLGGQDISSIFQAGANVTITPSGSNITITSAGSSNTNGTVTDVIVGNLVPLFTSSTSSPTTVPNTSFTLTNQVSGTFLAAPSAGAAGSPWFRPIQGQDIYPALVAGTNISLANNGSTITITGAGSSNTNGTVTSVGLGLPANTFSISGSPVANTGTLTGTFVSQVCGTMLMGPSAGANASPTWRMMTGSDLTGAIVAGSNITLTNNASNIVISSSGGGAVSSVSNVDGTLTISPTTGAVVASLANSVAIPGNPTTTTQATSDNSTKVATTAYVTTAITNAIAGVNPAVAVQVATTTILPNSPTYNNGVSGVGATLTTATLNTTLTIDGYSPVLNDRVLVKNQSDATQNGVYTLTQVAAVGLAWILTRASDYNTPSNINDSGIIPVINGTVNTDTSWLLTSYVTSIGSGGSNLTYTQFSLNPTTIVTGAGNLSPLFTTTTSANTINFSLSNAASGASLMGPVSGASAPATYRAITGQDINSAILAGINITTALVGSQLQISNSIIDSSICGGRLTTINTLISGASAILNDSSSSGSSTIYFAPYDSNITSYYNGSSWSLQQFSPLSYSVVGLGTGAFDIYQTLNGNTLILGASAWVNSTTPPSSRLYQDGVLHIGNTQQKVLGSIYVISGVTYDFNGARLVSNYNNQVPTTILAFDNTSSWTTTSTVPVAANGSTVNGVGQLQVFSCVQQVVSVRNFSALVPSTANELGFIAISFGGATVSQGQDESYTGGANLGAACSYSTLQTGLGTYIRQNYQGGVGGGTLTIYGGVKGFMEGNCLK